MHREIKFIVVHCTATHIDTSIERIERYWKEDLGWKKPGYHYIIQRNGEIVSLQPEHLIANGARDFNDHSIHIAWIGGIMNNKKAIDNRTGQQKISLYNKIVELHEKYPRAKIMGHRDFPNISRDCPSFDVRAWWNELYQPKPVAIKSYSVSTI